MMERFGSFPDFTKENLSGNHLLLCLNQMNPILFPECNTKFGPPEGYSEDHCKTIPAYVGMINEGCWEGSNLVVVAWKPTPEELADLNQDGVIYVAVIGGLMPHALSTTYREAIGGQR